MARESLKSKQKRMSEILGRLRVAFENPQPALEFSSPLELLMATILSAQCTDARVNIVTRSLFESYQSPQDYIDVPISQLEQEIHSTGFYHNKAVNIRKCCQKLIELHNSVVPSSMAELTELAGVGRKTANVVLGNAFGIPGIAVDTHVIRISGLLKMTAHTDPVKIEADLMKIVPQQDWTSLGHLIASHGRATCIARRPRCDECIVSDLCPSR